MLNHSVGLAQNDCRQDLGKSIEYYNAGMYEKTIELLENKIKKCHFRGSEKTQAFKYLAAAHYEIDNIEQADRYTYRFLKKDPLYEAQTTDPILFSEALDKFDRFPSITLGFMGGPAMLKPIISKKYIVWDAADYMQDYNTGYSNFFEFSISKNLFKYLNINSGISMTNYWYSRQIPFSDTTFVHFKESFLELKIPLELSSSIKIYRGFYTTLYAGIFYTRYLNLSGSFAESQLSQQIMLSEMIKASFDTENYRNIDNVGVSLGIGIDYRLERFIISTKISNSVSGLPFAKKEIGKVSNYEFNLYYTDDLFQLSNTIFSIGLKYTFLYKIKSKY